MAGSAAPSPAARGSRDRAVPTDPWGKITHDLAGTRSDLVPVLQRTQAAYGFLSEDSIRRVARWLKVSESEVFGVATFYAQFRFTAPGRHHVRVCLGTACHVKGGEQMLAALTRRLEVNAGETTADGEYDLERVACLGCCALAPVVTVDEKTYGQMNVLKLQGILDERGKS